VTPFHRGEQAAQERLGVRDQLELHGRRVIRDFMPEQHRAFFAELPFVVVGSLDREGQPWASLLPGPPGFASSLDPRHLDLRAAPLAGDPLADNLAVGAPLGVLGIQPSTRRRNRMNGTIDALAAGRASVRVRQSFGNCPKYIQARTVQFVEGPLDPPVVSRTDRLDPAMRALAGVADTFYLASSFDPADPAGGVDVSHRGGKPGFVRVDGNTLTVPDLIGNFYFNTIGNLLVHPRAGLLFIDFARGDRLHVAADAEIVWQGPEVDRHAGAQRLLRFHVREVRSVAGPLPLRFGPPSLSPFLGGDAGATSG
jgi:predicted pyridoxine 5'-phosphate oxidase superfamily flavin-nucleotide-binding protein